MFTRNGTGVFVLGIVLTVVCATVYGQQKVYKWVDEDGVVHFSEEPPPESADVEAKVITTDPAPAYVPPVQKPAIAPATAEDVVEHEAPQPEPARPEPVKEIDITAMSLAELDRRCEDGREERIAPLREAEIANCIETGTGDRQWCEAFWADYGDPVRTGSGHLTPRMFHDLPECTEAWEERNRRQNE